MVNSSHCVFTNPQDSPELPDGSGGYGHTRGQEEPYVSISCSGPLHPGDGSQHEGTRQLPSCCLRNFSLRSSQWGTICSNTDGPRDCHTEWSKPDRERQIPYAIAYMWTLKKGYKWTYLQNRNRVTDVENKLMVTRGKGGGGINWEIGIDIYTLLYIKQTTNKDLLYSTDNSTQYSVMTYMGKASKIE